METRKEGLSGLSCRFLDAISSLKISGYKLKQEGIIPSESTLTNIKNGIQQPSRKTIDALCDKYPVSKAWIYACDDVSMPDNAESAGILKKERLAKIYEYLRGIGMIHTKTEFANKIGAARSNVSKAFSGNEGCLTNSLLIRINSAFGNLFREEWLLEGKEPMLNTEPQPQSSSSDTLTEPNDYENGTTTSMYLKLLEQYEKDKLRLISENEGLKREIAMLKSVVSSGGNDRNNFA